jgi:hypothetical protein
MGPRSHGLDPSCLTGGAASPPSRTSACAPPTGSHSTRRPARGEPSRRAGGVRTGKEASFLGPRRTKRLDGEAFDPATNAWRKIAFAPLGPRWGGVRVRTGSELFVWGGGHPGAPGPARGASFDPETDSWRRVANAPLGLNLASGMWTGNEALVFGSLLNGRHGPTRQPRSVRLTILRTETWRDLSPSPLSPADRFPHRGLARIGQSRDDGSTCERLHRASLHLVGLYK